MKGYLTMVRALLAGERVGSPLQVLILLAVLTLSSMGLGLVLLYREQAHHAQVGEYQLCLQRENYDGRMHNLERADLELMLAMIDADRLFPAKIRHERDLAFQRKVAADQSYLATPIVDGCELVKP